MPASDTAAVFAALGDETRLAIVGRLSDGGAQSITRLAGGFPVSRQAITKHLNALHDAGLVDSRRLGRERLWQLRRRRLDDAQRHLAKISSRWDEAVDRLRAMVEGPGSDAH